MVTRTTVYTEERLARMMRLIEQQLREFRDVTDLLPCRRTASRGRGRVVAAAGSHRTFRDELDEG